MNYKSLFRCLSYALCLLCANVSTSQNLLDTSTWTVGQGSVSGFSVNGSASENIRENGFNHIGESVILWKAVPDSNSNADGGWNSNYISIDNSKTYRLSVWIKKTNSNTGSTYFGLASYTGGSQVLNLDGTTNSNPYFWFGDLPQLDRWYLLVGFVHEKNYMSTISEGKIYDGVTGLTVMNTIDFRFSNNATNLRHRAYLYWDTNTQDRQYFWEPRIDLIDGSEPTIEELLKINPDSKLLFSHDNAGNQKQRFYCDSPGCPVPNPPAGRPAPNSTNELAGVENQEIDDAIKDKIKISPNPTNGKFIISLLRDDQVMENQVVIYDTNGALLRKVKISESSSKLELDISDKPSGVYFVHVHFSNGTSSTKKIIKN